MYNSIPEVLRKESVISLFSTPTFSKSWEVWREKITDILGNCINEDNLLNLGDSLTEIFITTGIEGRDQGHLSGGGVAWESLVCWYINLCMTNSRVVAFRKMSLVPKPFQDAITVNYGNFACNTESDITVIVFPDKPIFNKKISQDDSIHIERNVNKPNKSQLDYHLLNELCSKDFDEFEIGVIQCKTNWNDNAQIPMLWDMIYSANGFKGRNITIGRNGFNIHNCKNFTYSFVTVPSNQKTKYKSDGVAVKRVTGLSGGNYWGKSTENSVARSLKEIFSNNFSSGSNSSIRSDLKKSLNSINSKLNYFKLI